MSDIQTRETDASVHEFIAGIENKTRRNDALVLLDLMQKVTGVEPKMWGRQSSDLANPTTDTKVAGRAKSRELVLAHEKRISPFTSCPGNIASKTCLPNWESTKPASRACTSTNWPTSTSPFWKSSSPAHGKRLSRRINDRKDVLSQS